MALGMYFVTAALITYSIAVWGEQITNDLKNLYYSAHTDQEEKASILSIWNKLLDIFKKSQEVQEEPQNEK